MRSNMDVSDNPMPPVTGNATLDVPLAATAVSGTAMQARARRGERNRRHGRPPPFRSLLLPASAAWVPRAALGRVRHRAARQVDARLGGLDHGVAEQLRDGHSRDCRAAWRRVTPGSNLKGGRSRNAVANLPHPHCDTLRSAEARFRRSSRVGRGCSEPPLPCGWRRRPGPRSHVDTDLGRG